MKSRIFNYMLFKRYLSSRSNLKPFLVKRFPDQSFWYFHDSIHFKELTFRNEKCRHDSNNETLLRKQLSDSIIKNANFMTTNNNCHQFSLETKLYILDTIAIIHGKDHKNTINFFDCLRPQIIFELQKQDIYVLMQLLYFSSIITTENRDDHNFMISQIVDRIETFLKDGSTCMQLCSTDIAVLSHSLFRLKIKFNNISILNLFSNLVSEDIQNNRIKKSHVLSIVKFMRINQYECDQRLFNAIKSFIKVHSKQFLFLECVHYLAFFANISRYDTNVYNYLVDERALKLLSVHSIHLLNGEKLRSKDLARFLWSVSLMNHKLDENVMTCICKHIKTLMSTDFQIYPHFLLDCLKSLIIMGIYPENLLLNSLNSKLWPKLLTVSKREKVALDLYFILESIAIERPSIELEKRVLLYSIAKVPDKSVEVEYRARPQLLKFIKLIKRTQKEKETRVEFSYILPHIRIASILVNGTSLEVIDSSLQLNGDSKCLNGLMQTKLRQMDRRDISYKLIYNYEDVKEFLNSI